jgi:hypothetical protein
MRVFVLQNQLANTPGASFQATRSIRAKRPGVRQPSAAFVSTKAWRSEVGTSCEGASIPYGFPTTAAQVIAEIDRLPREELEAVLTHVHELEEAIIPESFLPGYGGCPLPHSFWVMARRWHAMNTEWPPMTGFTATVGRLVTAEDTRENRLHFFLKLMEKELVFPSL